MTDTESLQARYLRRIDDLLQLLQLGEAPDGGRSPSEVAGFQEGFSGALGLADSVYGPNSSQVRQLVATAESLRARNPYPSVLAGKLAPVLVGFLVNLKSELVSGLVTRLIDEGFSLALGDFVTLAEEALEAGRKEVAAVLVSAALEDALKRKGVEIGLDVSGRDLSKVVNALKSSGFFQGAESRIVPSYVVLRNKAMHAEWDKFTSADVAGVVAYVKRFLIERF